MKLYPDSAEERCHVCLVAVQREARKKMSIHTYTHTPLMQTWPALIGHSLWSGKCQYLVWYSENKVLWFVSCQSVAKLKTRQVWSQVCLRQRHLSPHGPCEDASYFLTFQPTSRGSVATSSLLFACLAIEWNPWTFAVTKVRCGCVCVCKRESFLCNLF